MLSVDLELATPMLSVVDDVFININKIKSNKQNSR